MIAIVRARYDEPAHATALVDLLDHYARDPAGGGAPLSDFARGNLVASLAARPFVFSVLAFDGDLPVGLVNAIEGFSTFACKPLVNVHDVVVASSHRGRGIAARLFAEVEAIARERSACKLTLEVLSGNRAARALYEKLGFDDYQLDPAMGQAQFMQKWLG
ncbi:MAG: GNAT family N-acetyltransferase [Gammaproteobacteria bacterium]|jgi:ribosomal protein S18 acetylase RimI-like enzyme|nr:GNAT family N-acetyltransferase [Gammaproteobacteria bacterium]MBU1407947.1 GNAT family N-acetyltransferase [Gammaproteobacteria bacterium]MBU1532060.1 GNAT family N-acetyltransferase [Gammaproteobacteria bacterium]